MTHIVDSTPSRLATGLPPIELEALRARAEQHAVAGRYACAVPLLARLTLALGAAHPARPIAAQTLAQVRRLASPALANN